MLVGEKVKLRPLKKGDNELFFNWRNDINFIQMAQSLRFPKHELLEEQWLERAMTDISNRNIYFIVETLEDQIPIGFASLMNIDWISRNAFSGFAIMHPEFKGKGLSHDGFYTLFNYAFNQLNMHKLLGHLLAKNEISKKMCFKVGYEIEGTLKDHYYWNNEYHDVLYISAFKDKFNQQFRVDE